MLDIYDFYDKMERNQIMLSFKGVITSDLLTSILQIMEAKLEDLDERPKVRKKVFNVLVECLQNLYHHIEEGPDTDDVPKLNRSAIFMIGKLEDDYSIITGNFIRTEHVPDLRKRLDEINDMDRDTLKAYYKTVLSNGQISEKGGGGLGIIDIKKKSGQKLEYSFMPVDDENSFFSLNVKISPVNLQTRKEQV